MTVAGESYSAAHGETWPSSFIPQSLVTYQIQKLSCVKLNVLGFFWLANFFWFGLI